MPNYDYQCKTCGRKFSRFYKTYAEYDAAVPVCAHCGSEDVSRIIRKVRIGRYGGSSGIDLGALEAGDNAALDQLENADPATLGRVMREISDEIGEDLGDEFNDVVTRLEQGESPESIEDSLPPLEDLPDPGELDTGSGGLGDILAAE